LIVQDRTQPRLTVFVSMIGPSRNPDSSIRWVPVISPLPLRLKNAASTKVSSPSFLSNPTGRIAVTPVWVFPADKPPWPTLTPSTSMIALFGPAVQSKGMPLARA
jgi:hypothetical protein